MTPRIFRGVIPGFSQAVEFTGPVLMEEIMKLAKIMFGKTKSWMNRYARPLELARWEFLFEEESNKRVIRRLSAFQNKDGGFGHGLEPDFWTPASSPMATLTACQILKEIDVDPQEKIVQDLKSYFINTPQVGLGMWSSVLPENNLHPHAPWWHWEDGVQKGWMFNPSVELAAYLIIWSPPESTGAQLGWASLARAIEHVLQVSFMERHEVKNFRNCMSLLRPYKECFNSKVEYTFDQVEQKVQMLTLDVIDQDVSNWQNGYKPLPLDFIQDPNDPLFQDLQTLVEQNLQFYVQQLSAEGVWKIPWSWGQYPEEFAIARRYWQGIVAVERYKVFKAFDWI